MKKKLYYVKREVMAMSIETAARAKGHIYEISLAPDTAQSGDSKPLGGFKK